MNKTKHGSARTLIEDLELAYQAALAKKWGRWQERLKLWHGIDVTKEEILAKRSIFKQKEV